MESTEKSKYCALCQKNTNHITAKCPNITCSECGCKGHAKKFCPDTTNPRSESQSESIISLPKKTENKIESQTKIENESKYKVKRIIPPEDVKSEFKDVKRLKSLKSERQEIKYETKEDIIDQYQLILENDLKGNETQSKSKDVKPKSRSKNEKVEHNHREIFAHSGIIRTFSKESSLGSILDGKEKIWRFSQKHLKFKKGDFVTFDVMGDDVFNVSIIKKVKKEEKVKKPENPTENLCIFDVQFLSSIGEEDEFIQIGFVLMKDEAFKTHFVPINPSVIINERQKPLTLSKVGMKECHDTVIYVKSTPPKACCTEKEAMIFFVSKLQEMKAKIGFYVFDLDVLMPILKRKLNQYGLFDQFKKCIKWVCDLKSIVISKANLRHFKTFCWGKFNLIHEYVYDNTFPCSNENFNAEKSIGMLWLITEKMLDCDDLQKSTDFVKFFYSSKVLLKSNIVQCVDESRALKFKQVYHQSCLFNKIV